MKNYFSKCRFTVIVLIALIISPLVIIPFRMAIAYYLAPIPQAILTLGGGDRREVFTAEFALVHPELPIWVSSGSVDRRVREIFQTAGVDESRLHLDRRATDTVTNFTTLVEDFTRSKIQHLYLITSDFHMPRAKAIAYIVLGSQGIIFTPVALSTEQPPEAKLRIIRDIGRSIFWIFTKRTGSSLNNR